MSCSITNFVNKKNNTHISWVYNVTLASASASASLKRHIVNNYCIPQLKCRDVREVTCDAGIDLSSIPASASRIPDAAADATFSENHIV